MHVVWHDHGDIKVIFRGVSENTAAKNDVSIMRV
jgi:hypothetical protein